MFLITFPSFLIILSLLSTGNELLYRNRDGDVVKYNIDTDEQTVLVHNKKFVSLFFFFFFKDYYSDETELLSVSALKLNPNCVTLGQQIKPNAAPSLGKFNQMMHHFCEMWSEYVGRRQDSWYNNIISAIILRSPSAKINVAPINGWSKAICQREAFKDKFNENSTHG